MLMMLLTVMKLIGPIIRFVATFAVHTQQQHSGQLTLKHLPEWCLSMRFLRHKTFSNQDILNGAMLATIDLTWRRQLKNLVMFGSL